MRYIKLFSGFLIIISMMGTGCSEWFGKADANAMENDTTLSLVIREWSKRIRQYPENDEYRYKRGLELAEAKRYDLALADMDKAIDLKPQVAQYHLGKANVLFAQNETKKALESYEEAVKVEPKNEEALLSLGRFLLFVRQFDKSELRISQLIKENPANADAWFYKGMLKKETGDTAAAIESFQQAVAIDAYNYNSLIQLGNLYSEKKDTIGLAYFHNATLVDEYSDEAWYGLGLLYQRLGRYDSAIAKYQQTINVNPSHYYAYYNTGYILFSQNNWDRAIEHFRIALKFAPEFAKAHYMLGLCNEAKQNPDEAIVHYERCLQVDPNFQLAKDAIQRVRSQSNG